MRKNLALSFLCLGLGLSLVASPAQAAKKKRSIQRTKLSSKTKSKIKNRIEGAQGSERAALLEEAGLYHAAYLERLQWARSSGMQSQNLEKLGNLALVLDRFEPLRGVARSGSYPQSFKAAVAGAHLRQGNLAAAREVLPDNINGITSSAARIKAASIAASVLGASGQTGRAQDILGSVPEAQDPVRGGFLQLQRARLAFSEGKLLEATEALQRVTRQSPSWHPGVLVSAWAAYRAKDYNLSLGQLMTLTSPYLVGKFNPEAFILQSAALYRLCYFDGASESIRKLRTLYGNLPQSLDRFARSHGNRFSLVSAVVNYARGASTQEEGTYPPGHYEFIMDGLLSSEPISEVDRSLSQVKREQDNISELLSSANLGSQRQNAYRQDLENARKEYYRKGVKAATRRLAMMRKDLNEALENALAIEVEINTRVRDRLITGKTGRMKDVDFDAEIKKGYEFWPFNGEYWQDEVGGYAFATSDVCGEQGS